MSIGIVVVGPGLIGKKHIALIKANPDTHLAAIVAPDHEINHQLAKFSDVEAVCLKKLETHNKRLYD
jgi:predicted dehydrogenase